ncbi:hypothetical protein ElyMa_006991300 [Elysia marginata]|uniref:Uncharacterized protein n=1 Tax=Elysia marginata TaxID=1093978 RepID=A0AAV4JMJ8_9GAST|nr:hypothetical protein ElyMa_006991300 [Elysia marginata]
MAEATRPIWTLPLQKEIANYCRYFHIAKYVMLQNTSNIERNDVKGWSASSRSVSSGRGRQMPQVIPDRQQATVCKLRQIIRVGTWNIRTLLQKGKLDNIKMEMERVKHQYFRSQ